MKFFVIPESLLNPFYLSRRLFRIPGLAFVVLLLCVSACSKSARINENKAFVAITQAAPGSSPVDVLYNNISILNGSLLAYDQTTGVPGSPYVPATAGVRVLEVKEGTKTVLQGNTAFQQGLYYSLFIYDTLRNDSLKMFILQDNLPIRTDTFTYVRYINFSPGTYLNLLLTSKRDTVATGFLPYAGNKLDPDFYPFRLIHIGNYAARAFVDTLYSNSMPLDSIRIDSTKVYTIFFQGNMGSAGADSLKLKSLRHN